VHTHRPFLVQQPCWLLQAFSRNGECMSTERVIFFPARSNAASLVRGMPVESIRRRLKLASLMYDHVYLEAGVTEISAGPGGSFAVSTPPFSKPVTWQTGHDRRSAGRSFSIALTAEVAPGVRGSGPAHVALQSTIGINWRATLEPFADEIPDAPWIGFAETQPLPRNLDSLSSDWSRRVTQEPPTPERDRYSRDAIAKHAAEDFIRGIAGRGSVSMDSTHIRSLAQMADAGLHPDYGLAVLNTVVPTVAGLSWQEIARLRNMGDVIYWRESLVHIAEMIQEEIQGGADFENLVLRRYQSELANANTRAQSAFGAAMPSLFGTLMGAAVDGLVFLGGVQATPIGVGTPLGFAIGLSADALLRRGARRWVAADAILRGLD
jgi:hypothetical protein